MIHAGIYYPAGSLMARACVEGKHMLYDYCRERGVPHARCGKLIVATNEEEAGKLEAIQGRAAANGVPDLALLTREEALAMEPALSCTAALLSPSTGIIDSHAFMLSLQGDAENAGARVRLPRAGRVRAASARTASRSRSAAPSRWSCAAAPWSTPPGCTRRGSPARSKACREDAVPGAWYAKGNYFTLTGRNPFSRLIYPVPVPGGLGTHLTIDLGGQARFGPDVEWVDAIDYDVDPAPRRKLLRRHPPLLARTCRTAPWRPAIPASGRRRFRPARRPRIL